MPAWHGDASAWKAGLGECVPLAGFRNSCASHAVGFGLSRRQLGLQGARYPLFLPCGCETQLRWHDAVIPTACQVPLDPWWPASWCAGSERGHVSPSERFILAVVWAPVTLWWCGKLAWAKYVCLCVCTCALREGPQRQAEPPACPWL